MISSIDAMGRNVGYALRVLARTPGLTLTVILTLALGIGASSAVFTIVEAVLLEPLPFPDADRLVSVRQTRESATVANVAPVRLEEWNERNSTFEALMGYTTQDAADASADVPESIRVAGVSRRMMEVWGIAPILGRGFVAADHEANAADVAIDRRIVVGAALQPRSGRPRQDHQLRRSDGRDRRRDARNLRVSGPRRRSLGRDDL